ncbi:hypothetical protein ACMHYB_31800 [Sorangium sp. So ce1128]
MTLPMTLVERAHWQAWMRGAARIHEEMLRDTGLTLERRDAVHHSVLLTGRKTSAA